MRIRKKVVELEAVLIDYRPNEGHCIVTKEPQPKWFRDAIDKGVIYFDLDGDLAIKTDTGIHTAKTGDYILQGTQGEIYPVKADVFPEIYDIIDE